MEAILFDVRTSHAPGKFCRRKVSADYFISCFETPFLYERDGTLERGDSGDFLIVPPGMPIYHGSVPEGESGFVNDWIFLRSEELPELLTRYPLPMGNAFKIQDGEILRRYLTQVRREYTDGLPGYQEQLLYLTGQLVIALYRELHCKDIAAKSPLEGVRERILRSPEKTWTLEEMAKLSGYSASRFSALYREQFGVAPKQDLLNIRLELAAKMLKYSSATVTEVAYSCGFQSIHYFSKYFKHTMGVSPKTYAEKSESKEKRSSCHDSNCLKNWNLLRWQEENHT